MHSGNVPVDHPPQGAAVGEDAFINDHDAVDGSGDDDEDDDKPKADKKAGRRKIKIEFIQDKSRRHITFSKRKAGIMKKAYELSTLTGTQVLLLVVSETGLVYTFTTAKLQPLVTQPEGKNLIQACLNAPHGALPSSMPVGPPIGRASGPMSIPGGPAPPNIPGGLSIGSQPGNASKDEDDDHDDDPAAHGGRPNSGDKRRRRASSAAGPPPGSATRGPTSPHSPNASVPPPLSIPPGQQGQHTQHSSHQTQPSIALGSPTSPQQHHPQVPSSNHYSSASYGQHPGQPQAHQQHDANLYGNHMMPGYSYGGAAPPAPGGQQLGGLTNAAASHGHWGPAQNPPVGQSNQYARR